MSIADTGQTQTPPAPGWTADDSSFGARLALIRQHMGWGNVARAAKECGVPTDSWRNWEVDGREPHRLITIAMTIATRTGCDLDWLVYGPSRARGRTTALYGAGARVLRQIEASDQPMPIESLALSPTRAVRRTRPIDEAFRRPLTPVAV